MILNYSNFCMEKLYSKNNLFKTFWKMFIPTVIVLYIFYAIWLTDFYFAAKIDVYWIAALQAVFPLYFLLISLGEWFATATNNLVSIALWEKSDYKKNVYFAIGLIYSFLLWFLMYIFASDIAKWLLWFMDLSDKVYNYWYEYITILLKYSFFSFIINIIYTSLIIFHKYKWQFIYALFWLIWNAFFDRLFAIKLWYWIKWIAYATVVGYLFAVFFFFVKFIWIDKMYDVFVVKLKDIKKYFLTYIKYWLGAFLSMVIFVIEFSSNNYFSGKFWDLAIAAYWLTAKILDFFTFPIFAVMIVFSTIYGYFYWWRKFEELKYFKINFLKYFISYIFIAAWIIWFGGIFFIEIFSNNQEILQFSNILTKIISLFLIFFSLNFFYSQIFQITWYHWLRISLNIWLVITIVSFEIIFFKIRWTFNSIWIAWLIAQIIFTFLAMWFYYFWIKKKIYKF